MDISRNYIQHQWKSCVQSFDLYCVSCIFLMTNKFIYHHTEWVQRCPDISLTHDSETDPVITLDKFTFHCIHSIPEIILPLMRLLFFKVGNKTPIISLAATVKHRSNGMRDEAESNTRMVCVTVQGGKNGRRPCLLSCTEITYHWPRHLIPSNPPLKLGSP